ncbi:MAG TPA: hypothetical protein VKI01_06435 [Acidimicrobiia bacterium]|nr:hypothetical protein [Acidimicrobiia bacterium]
MLGALVACSGGAGGDRRAAPRSTASPTSAPPSTIDLSRPIPGGSLHGTPRPPLENTGTDYVAITRSLIGNFRWLTENPDPAVVSDLYAPGTAEHEAGVRNIQYLVDQGWRAADDAYFIVSVEPLNATPQAVSLRMTDSMETERIVDGSGHQVGRGRPRSPKVKTWSVLLSIDESGRWRMADFAPADAQSVQL